MAAIRADLEDLRRLVPADDGLTVFDAETQDTSYGILVVGALPLIFDTHRKEGRYVSTVEILTEITRPLRLPSERVRAFARTARRHGLLAIPYSACFFKGNLHVYAFSGPMRGLDVATVGGTVAEAETRLDARLRAIWPKVPPEILRAQRDLVAGRRRVRYAADLEVLQRKLSELRGTLA
ncbi:MAG: hypothetical protein A3K66_04955 [Euryarchaeota archaeon RBG_16_67_27]|nr:MAG: hypothetical protein A3K66_04955 [Euryarchaeota archaeon RBG_16_67_27]